MKMLSAVLICAVLSVVAVGQMRNKTKAERSPAPPPDEISGMYTFLQEGEFVQITIEDKGRVTGFVSRRGELDSDRGAFLDQFIKTGSIDGDRLTFTTDPVHGTWYEFQGTFARGDAKIPNEEGYYVLRGTLTEYNTDASWKTSARARQVLLKSLPSDTAAGKPKRD